MARFIKVRTVTEDDKVAEQIINMDSIYRVSPVEGPQSTDKPRSVIMTSAQEHIPVTQSVSQIWEMLKKGG